MALSLPRRPARIGASYFLSFICGPKSRQFWAISSTNKALTSASRRTHRFVLSLIEGPVGFYYMIYISRSSYSASSWQFLRPGRTLFPQPHLQRYAQALSSVTKIICSHWFICRCGTRLTLRHLVVVAVFALIHARPPDGRHRRFSSCSGRHFGTKRPEKRAQTLSSRTTFADDTTGGLRG